MKRLVAVFASLVFAFLFVAPVYANQFLDRDASYSPPVYLSYLAGDVTTGIAFYHVDMCASYQGVTQKDGTCRATYNFHLGPDYSRCRIVFASSPLTEKGLGEPTLICTWKPKN